jgi:hypothetical protein
MSQVPTIRDAQQALETLQRFLDTMSTMFGQFAEVSLAKKSEPIARVTARTRKKKNGKMTWKEKVSAILQDARKPVQPKFITDEYENRFEWSGKRSVLGNRIRSTLALMKKDGEVSVTPSGYTLPKQGENS